MTGGTPVQRARAGAVAALSWLACRLPEGPLVRLADLAGETWYRAAPARAARGRENLRRVCCHMAAVGLGSPATQAAGTDDAALERLVRRAFRHAARYYLEVARTPAFGRERLARDLAIETPDALDEAFAGEPVIFVGLHFGAIELPALYLAERSGQVATAPMETIDDPPLQAWFTRTRGAVGVRIVTLREARRALIAALRRGEPVGLVADRDLTGGGVAVPFFGHPAPMPAGPALVALETGARVYVTSVRRIGGGRYRGRAERVDLPAEGTRRERVEAFLRAEAAAFERAIAIAPEQWWGAFFPVWPDLEERAAGGTKGSTA